MSKKSRKKSATSLEAQARAHETLYGKDWYEVGVYRRQAQEIIKKAKARLEEGEIAEKEKDILRKRLREYEEGRREIDKSLLFYKILKRLNENKPVDLSDDRVKDNLKILEELEYTKNMEITAKGKKMLRKK